MKGKKVTAILASGGVYAPGSQTEAHNVAGSHLKRILGFIGMTDVTVLLAGGTTAVDMGKATLPELLNQFAPEVSAAHA